jgi:hypothetical protein
MKQKNRHNVRESGEIERDQDKEEQRYGKKIPRKRDRMRGYVNRGDLR